LGGSLAVSRTGAFPVVVIVTLLAGGQLGVQLVPFALIVRNYPAADTCLPGRVPRGHRLLTRFADESSRLD
jgi:hypothetical protein